LQGVVSFFALKFKHFLGYFLPQFIENKYIYRTFDRFRKSGVIALILIVFSNFTTEVVIAKSPP